jgi:hypothetical protein
MVAAFAAWTDQERYVRERIMFAARGDDASDVFLEYEEPGLGEPGHTKSMSIEFGMDRDTLQDPREFRKLDQMSMHPPGHNVAVPYCMESVDAYSDDSLHVNKIALRVEALASERHPDKELIIDHSEDVVTVPDLRGEIVDSLISVRADGARIWRRMDRVACAPRWSDHPYTQRGARATTRLLRG